MFRELPERLREGDVLVLNDTRVIPAMFGCHRRTGGRIEGLFLRELSLGRWQVMLRGGGRCRSGEVISLSGEDNCTLMLSKRLDAGVWEVAVAPPVPAPELLDRVGRTPLPPYIRRPGPMTDAQDRAAYQTVFAARPGAVAAPTAGLHFTEAVLEALRGRGVQLVTVTLHVGLGTFEPVRTERLEGHSMHPEWYELPAAAAEALAAARRDHRRIVAVGTTSVRVLETAAATGPLAARQGWTNLFIHPPAEFRATDALLTNFHLPRSTLLMLVAAFCAPGSTGGLRLILDAYAEAVQMRYRFYSYGDAMLIL